MTHLTKRPWLLLPVWLLLCTGANAQSSARHEFSLQQAIEYAHRNNVQVKNALLDVQLQKESNRDITSAALPSVTGSVNLTDYVKLPTSLIPGEFFGQPAGTYIPVQFGTKYNSTATLQLQQLLFDGQVFIALKARATSIDFRNASREVTEEMIRTNINKVYYQLVASKTQIELLDANIDRLEKLQHDTKVLYQNGFAEKLDIDKISVQLSNLETEKTKALNSIQVGYLGLKTLLGMPVRDTLILTDRITEDDIKAGLLQDTAYQYTDRKDYQFLDYSRKLNEFNIRRYQLSYIPSLSLTGAYSKNAQRQTFDFLTKGGNWFTTSYIGLNLSIPIFDGFSRSAKIRQAKLQLQQTQNQIDDLKLNIDNQVEQARINFQSALATMDYQKKNMQLAESVYAQTKKKYEVGTGSNTEITAAQTDLITAQTNYINAMYAAIIARIDYLKAVGKI